MKKNKLYYFSALVLAIMLATIGCNPIYSPTNTENPTPNSGNLPMFTSEEELVTAFTEGRNQGYYFLRDGWGGMDMVFAEAAPQAAADNGAKDISFSDTNIQVAGVDEADIIKTDGKYIYVMANNSLYLVEAYPAESARILAHVAIADFNPQELFIDGDRLLVFGMTYYYPDEPTITEKPDDPVIIEPGMEMSDIMPYPFPGNLVSIKLYDIKDRSNPVLLKSVDIEGSYLTSRKIGSDVYFVINSYPNFISPEPLAVDIIPGYQETIGDIEPSIDLKPIANYSEIGYIPPQQASNFITVASLSMSDESREMGKTVVVGSGENVFASLSNLYIAQTSWPVFEDLGEPIGDYVQSTVVTKFALSSGEVNYVATGEVKGHIINQFAMDEYDGYFRIATTISGYVDNRDTSTNNIYVLDEELKATGALEDVAPGESIYAVRFMGKRAYMITFLHVDPL
ncbi:MAG: beta-propeller domain-containing protein, partial [Dehalococcoidia bacterium]